MSCFCGSSATVGGGSGSGGGGGSGRGSGIHADGCAGGGGCESAEQISQTHRRSCPATRESRVLALADREY